jgi:hypothetical protein
MVNFYDKEYLWYVGDLGQDVCDEYILVASKGLSEETIKQRIKAGEIKTRDPDIDEDIKNFDEIEFVESSRWTIVKLLTYG